MISRMTYSSFLTKRSLKSGYLSEVRVFVTRYVRPYLVNNGYKVVVPLLDLPPGGVLETEMLSTMHKSKTILVILSENFDKVDTTTGTPPAGLFFKHALNYYKNTPGSKMILVRYDGVKLKKLSLPHIRALARVNGYVNVTDRHISVYSKLQELCGRPLARERLNVRKFAWNA